MIASALASLLVLGAGTHVPEAAVSPDLRVHLLADEALPADALASLARPRAVLWLRTGGNTLRPATAKALSRFESAWVEVRPPVNAVQAGSFGAAPAAGLWLREGTIAAAWLTRFGARPFAQDHAGPWPDLPESARAAAARAPSRMGWSPHSDEALTVGALSLIAAGRRPVLLVLPEGTAPPECDVEVPALAFLTVRTARLADAAAWSRCGAKVRVPVPAGITEEALAPVLRSATRLELEVEVGGDERRALAARRLLERLTP